MSTLNGETVYIKDKTVGDLGKLLVEKSTNKDGRGITLILDPLETMRLTIEQRFRLRVDLNLLDSVLNALTEEKRAKSEIKVSWKEIPGTMNFEFKTY